MPGFIPPGSPGSPSYVQPAPTPSRGPSPDTQSLIQSQGGASSGKYIAVYNPQTKTYWDGFMGPDGKMQGQLLDTGSAVLPQGATLQGPPAPSAGGTTQPPVMPYGAGSGGGGMTAYEQAQVALDKQKLADAEAQQKADQAYREAQAVDAFNKNWQDYQVKNYYGSFYGPAAAAPAGSPWAYRLPEPSYIQDYYKNNPQAGPDPFSQPIQFSGYSGSGYLNPQQPGIQNAGSVPSGSVAAPIQGQAPANPFPGAIQGSVGYDPNTAQTGQNIAPPMGGTQPQTLDPNLLNVISSHPAANQFVMSLPGAQDFVAKAMTQQPAVTPPIPGGTNG